MAARPDAVAFDLIETLMPLDPLRARLADAGEPGHLLEVWFTRTLRDGMALSAAGDYTPFPDVAAAALRTVTGGRLDDGQIQHVLDGFFELPPHPDTLPAARRLAGAGVALACLTNGSPRVASSFVERAGLAGHVREVITIGEVRQWKPAAAVYRHAASRLGVPPGRLALVAAHAWDCHGAKRAGLTAGWVSRLEGSYPTVFAAPDVTGAGLLDVADALLALPAGS